MRPPPEINGNGPDLTFNNTPPQGHEKRAGRALFMRKVVAGPGAANRPLLRAAGLDVKRGVFNSSRAYATDTETPPYDPGNLNTGAPAGLEAEGLALADRGAPKEGIEAEARAPAPLC